MQHTAHQ